MRIRPLLLLLVLLALASSGPGTADPSGPPRYDPDGPALKVDGVVPGMTESEVAALLGRPGKVLPGEDPLLSTWFYPGGDGPPTEVLMRSLESSVGVVQGVSGRSLSQGGTPLLGFGTPEEGVKAALGEPDGRVAFADGSALLEYALPTSYRLAVTMRGEDPARAAAVSLVQPPDSRP